MSGMWIFALMSLCVIALVSVLNALCFPRLGGVNRRKAPKNGGQNVVQKGAAPDGLGEMESAPRVSILVPARDEANNLPRTLDGLLNQQYPNYEVLVLDDELERWDF